MCIILREIDHIFYEEEREEEAAKAKKQMRKLDGKRKKAAFCSFCEEYIVVGSFVLIFLL